MLPISLHLYHECCSLEPRYYFLRPYLKLFDLFRLKLLGYPLSWPRPLYKPCSPPHYLRWYSCRILWYCPLLNLFHLKLLNSPDFPYFVRFHLYLPSLYFYRHRLPEPLCSFNNLFNSLLLYLNLRYLHYRTGPPTYPPPPVGMVLPFYRYDFLSSFPDMVYLLLFFDSFRMVLGM